MVEGRGAGGIHTPATLNPRYEYAALPPQHSTTPNCQHPSLVVLWPGRARSIEPGTFGCRNSSKHACDSSQVRRSSKFVFTDTFGDVQGVPFFVSAKKTQIPFVIVLLVRNTRIPNVRMLEAGQGSFNLTLRLRLGGEETRREKLTRCSEDKELRIRVGSGSWW